MHYASLLSLGLCVAVPGTAQSAPAARTTLDLRVGTFDPIESVPHIPEILRGNSNSSLWIVQFASTPGSDDRASLLAAGATVLGYLPTFAHVVRAKGIDPTTMRGIANVRWVGRYEPAYRLEPLLLAEIAAGEFQTKRRYNLVVTDRTADKTPLANRLRALGATVRGEGRGGLLLEAEMTGLQLTAAARDDEVLWIDRWFPLELDVDNARAQGGADHIETVAGYTGAGVRGHVYEGVQQSHPDFTNTPIVVASCTNPASHGHATAGIVFGNGTSNPAVRGFAPDAQPFFTNPSSGGDNPCLDPSIGRWDVFQELVTTHDVMFSTASWGSGRTLDYTSISADSDAAMFDHDLPWSQSQSNGSSQASRPQAWAKNATSVGGVRHYNNDDAVDDSWGRGGSAGSTGPAADGRIKPELCAFYDSVGTSDRTGDDGYSPNDWFGGFGGTSASTPIIAGQHALAIQMFTDGLFGPLRVPGGSRFENRPHAATLKTLMIAHARQYVFHEDSTDNRREHQGFGYPDLRLMYDNRDAMLLIDETDLLVQGQARSYPFVVPSSETELKIALAYNDPAANPAAATTRVNDLDLRVIDPSGTVYHGNHGLHTGNYSEPGGAPNSIDTVECVFVHRPPTGTWTIEVTASAIVADGHVETPGDDADFGLCATFGTAAGRVYPFGTGCVGTGATDPWTIGVNDLGGSLSLSSPTYLYAYQVATTEPISVTGFSVFTASQTGGAEVVPVEIYGAGPSGALATATLTVGSNPDFYTATFASPVQIPPGKFFVGVDHRADTIYLGNLTGGEERVCYFRSDPDDNWSTSSTLDTPSIRIFVQGHSSQPSEPVFTIDGPAVLGSSLEGRVRFATPNAPASLVIGFSNDFLSGVPLPLDLGVVGAPGCSLLTDFDVTTPYSTNSFGRIDGIDLAIDNAPGLLGLEFFEQVLVLDAAANALGAVSSRGWAVTVGE